MPDIGKILCPVDFSEFSTRALTQATTLARWYGAEVHMLHVVPALPTLWRIAPTLGPHVPEAAPAVPREAALNDLVRSATEAGVQAVAEVLEGDPARWIVDYAARSEIDLIVMGTHGRGGLERLVLGSVTEKVLRRSPCPVVTTCRGQGPDGDGPPFKRMLCALDFTPPSERALGLALSLAQEADAELTLLHVMDPYDERWLHEHALMTAQEYRGFLERQVAARLARAIAPEARLWCRVRDRLETGDPGEQIVRVAADVDAQLVIMGRRSRSAGDDLLFASTTHQVVRQALCAVLTTREAPLPPRVQPRERKDEANVGR